jgi:hypothetical protein
MSPKRSFVEPEEFVALIFVALRHGPKSGSNAMPLGLSVSAYFHFGLLHSGLLRSVDSSCAIMQRKSDTAWLVRTVAPGVIGAALDHGIAGLEMNFGGVQDQGDLAFEHQTEVERLRLLHVRVRRLGRIG